MAYSSVSDPDLDTVGSEIIKTGSDKDPEYDLRLKTQRNKKNLVKSCDFDPDPESDPKLP